MVTFWSGNFFDMTYWLDDRYGVQAAGVGRVWGDSVTTRPTLTGYDDMILSGTPRIRLMESWAKTP